MNKPENAGNGNKPGHPDHPPHPDVPRGPPPGVPNPGHGAPRPPDHRPVG